MIASGISVTRVSIEVGYNDYNYFSRVFREIIGVSPSEVYNRTIESVNRII